MATITMQKQKKTTPTLTRLLRAVAKNKATQETKTLSSLVGGSDYDLFRDDVFDLYDQFVEIKAKIDNSDNIQDEAITITKRGLDGERVMEYELLSNITGNETFDQMRKLKVSVTDYRSNYYGYSFDGSIIDMKLDRFGWFILKGLDRAKYRGKVMIVKSV